MTLREIDIISRSLVRKGFRRNVKNCYNLHTMYEGCSIDITFIKISNFQQWIADISISLDSETKILYQNIMDRERLNSENLFQEIESLKALFKFKSS